MSAEKLSCLFNQYVTAFKHYDLSQVSACYHLPCTLHTPDKVILLTELQQCKQVFGDIFSQLQQAKTSDIIVKKASYSRVTSEVLLVSIEWDFIDSQGAVFADFCATYHLIQIKDELKIISVVSHDLSSAIVLAHKFSLMA